MVSKNFHLHEEISNQRLVFIPAREHLYVGPKKTLMHAFERYNR